MDLQPGMLITPSLRLVRLLGQGGMGSVWVADHLGLKTQVAVKFMSGHIALHPEAVARFEREAEAAAQIKSPHVVQLLDHGVMPGGVPYTVMELLDGEDLGKRIERHGALPVDEVAEILRQACRALARAHALGIVHRDIKPDNIFLTETDGERLVKVLDFGIAKRAAGPDNPGVTSTGMLLGTPNYMSPEQTTSSKGVDHRSDLWSLGVVAYHALTGMLPFNGETFGALVLAIDRGVYAPPFATRGVGSPELDTWFERALSRDVRGRFDSAKEMSDAFAAAVRGVRPSLAQAPAQGAPQSFASNHAYAAGATPLRIETTGAPLASSQPTGASFSTTTRTVGSRKLPLALAVGAVSVLVVGAGLTRSLWAPAAPASSAAVPHVTAEAVAAPITAAPPAPPAAEAAPSITAEVELAPVASASASSAAAPVAPARRARPASRPAKSKEASGNRPAPANETDDYGF